MVLKPLTPQNIVIGGASGAMPPVLGWAAIRGDVGPEALILCLIIFLWTPPHFWALALYRAEDYRRAGLPMLPVTHGAEFTRLHVLLYTLVLFAATLLPFVAGMSGGDLPGRGDRARRDVQRLRLAAVAHVFRRARAADLPLLDRLPDAALRRAAGRPLPVAALSHDDLAAAPLALGAAALALLAGCDRISGSRREAGLPLRPTSPAPSSRDDLDLPDVDGNDAHARRLEGQGRRRLLRLHAVPRRLPDDAWPSSRRSSKLLGADGRPRCRPSS